jgi:hypothetical protein
MANICHCSAGVETGPKSDLKSRLLCCLGPPFAIGRRRTYNVSMPASNKRLFVITFIVAVIAILGFIWYTNYNKTPRYEYGVNNGHGTTTMELPLGNIEEEEPGPTPVDAFAWTEVFFTTINAFPDGKGAGSIGCGDGLVSYRIPVDEINAASRGDLTSFLLRKIQDPTFFAEAKAAYAASFEPAVVNSPITVIAGPKDKNLQLYSVLTKAKLTVQSLKDVPGAYEVKFKGTAPLGGVCDEPRQKAQLQHLAESGVATTTGVTVYLNGKKI